MAKAYSYIRFSTPEQSKGDSLRRQEEDAIEYAAEHGLELDTTLNLRDQGLSAFTGENVTAAALETLGIAENRAALSPILGCPRRLLPPYSGR